MNIDQCFIFKATVRVYVKLGILSFCLPEKLATDILYLWCAFAYIHMHVCVRMGWVQVYINAMSVNAQCSMCVSVFTRIYICMMKAAAIQLHFDPSKPFIHSPPLSTVLETSLVICGHVHRQ